MARALLAAAGAATLAAFAASAASHPRVVLACSPHVEAVSTSGISQVILNGVATVPDGSVWAVGETSSLAYPSRPVILRVRRGRVSRVLVPTLPASRAGYELRAVVAQGAADAWAVGLNVVLHWDGRHWQHARAPAGSYWAVAASGPKNVWAVGTDSTGYLVAHWDGLEWRRVPPPHTPPAPAQGAFTIKRLEGVLPLGTRDVWVVGGGPPFAAHWDGAAWESFAMPAGQSYNADAHLDTVLESSPQNLWVAGDGALGQWASGSWLLADYSGYQGYIVQPVVDRRGDLWGVSGSGGGQMVGWNGSAWEQVGTALQGISLNDLTVDRRGDVWAVGIFPGDPARVRPAIVHYRC
jgi:hypothetical protein